MPAVAGYIRAGNIAAARGAVGPDADLPEPSERDTAIIDAWRAMDDPRLGGVPFSYFQLHCDVLGLDSAARLEVWRRTGIIDAMVQEWRAATGRRGTVI